MENGINRFELAQKTLRQAETINHSAKQLWPTIRDLNHKEYDKDNEEGLMRIIFDKTDAIIAVNETYLYREHLRDLDLANDNYSLADDIMNAAHRLWPTIERMRDPLVNKHFLDILVAANEIRFINREYAQKKILTNEAEEIAKSAFEKGD